MADDTTVAGTPTTTDQPAGVGAAATDRADGSAPPPVASGDGVVGGSTEPYDRGYHGDDAADHGYAGRPEDSAPFGAGFGKQKL